jgi:hypothetical protein
VTVNDLETLVTETLRHREREAPTADRLLDGVRRRESLARTRRARWVTAGAAAAVVAVVATGVVLRETAIRPPNESPSTTPAATAPGTLPEPAAGMQWVGYRGLFVQVPESWIGGETRCGQPVENAVLDWRGARCMALIPRPRGISDVELRAPRPDDAPYGEPTTVDGWRALRPYPPAERHYFGDETENLVEMTLTLVDRPVVITVTSPDPALAASILDTAQVVDVDPSGCALQSTSTVAGTPARPGAADALVPGDPTAARLCHYDRGWLERAQVRDAAATARLAAALNALRPGFNETEVELGQMLQGHCPEDDADFIVATFDYASGPPLDVYVRADACRQRGASNGARAGRVTWAFLDEVRGLYYSSGGNAGIDGPPLEIDPPAKD